MNIKTELNEYLIKYNGGYNHRNAIRYLSKRNPSFWQEILKITDFLPDDAKPKQRVWHILNDCYEQPKCPITNETVKWWENRYLEYSSRSAVQKDPKIQRKKIQTYEKRTGHTGHWSSDPIIKKQKIETVKNNIDEFGLTSHQRGARKVADFRKNDIGDFGLDSYQRGQLKMQATCIEKYGVDNNSKRKDVIAKLKDPNKSARDRYREDVQYYTRQNWKEHFYKINPKRLERGSENHLDHIFSVYEGFEQNIPPEIIGHWTNLQMLKYSDNNKKSTDCWKTKEELYEDYYKY